jgi:nucleoside-diphosphate-sugar epimerase
VVLMSSTTGYPDCDGDCTEADFFTDAPPESWRGLGWTYRYIEAVARISAERVADPIGVTALRPTLVYGERDSFDPAHAHFLPAFVRRVVARENPIEVWGDGTATRDLIHAEDVARAAILAVHNAGPGFRAYNIGAGRQHSVSAILDRLLALDGHRDAPVAYRHDRPTSARRRGVSTANAARELGFAPAVDLEAGLARTLAHYRARSRHAA